MWSTHLLQQSKNLLDKAKEADFKISCAESCTGGLLFALLTEIPGSSAVMERGFNTYTNNAKNEMVNVTSYLFDEFGAVSKEVAAAMAEGALSYSHADITVGITGIAGPDGGSKEKPVGTVYIAVARKKYKTAVKKFSFSGSRTEIRLKSVEEAMTLLSQAF